MTKRLLYGIDLIAGDILTAASANTVQAATLIKSGAGVWTLSVADTQTWTVPNNAAGFLKNDGAGALSWDAGTTAAHDILSVTHGDTLADTVAAGDVLIGNATPKWSRLAAGAQYKVLTMGASLPAWSDYLLDGTAGGKTVLNVTNTKTLTLTSADTYTLTIPKTGTVPVGTGTATRLAEWVTDANTLQASTLIKTGAQTLTLDVPAGVPVAVEFTGDWAFGINPVPAGFVGFRIAPSAGSTLLVKLTDSTGQDADLVIASDAQLTVGAGNSSISGANTGDQSGANPTASVGLTAVNGAAATFMRSDAAPPLDVGIAPTWTAVHTFSNTTDSSSTSTGAIVTAGGIGLAKALTVGTVAGIGIAPNASFGMLIDHASQAALYRVLDAGTTNTPRVAELRHRTSGTAAAGFGIDFIWTADTNGAANRAQYEEISSWVNATDGTRKARVTYNVYDTAIREAIRIEASGTAPLIGFLGAAAVARAAHIADATGAADAITRINAILVVLENLGFVATS